MKYHVVCDKSDNSALETYDNEAIWTISRDPNKPGWRTDGAYPGYGLTLAEAEWLVAAANEKLEREGKS
jgi:hypothetical protein